MKLRSLVLFPLAALALSACMDDKARVTPDAQALSTDANGYFCGMVISEHPGPKAQIHITGEEDPIWFSAVRDMFGFLMLPGESREVAAVYVTDMSQASSWEDTNNGPWMNPKDAFFVINSSRMGGMGALEAVPFSVKADAEAFTKEFGGEVVAFEGVGLDYIFENVSMDQ